MIARDPPAASSMQFDLIVIGGGIYGVCMAYEAAQRGLRPLLLERDDFGGATSWNSLRIVHGGLRYLQTLDITRHIESVRERRWFLRTFPELVRPLPCMMPLYSGGSVLKKPAVLRAALRMNDVLSCTRNCGVRLDRRLGDGRMLSAIDARLRFPLVRRDGLCAAALWHDAAMVSPQRILMEMLRAGCSGGARALNYVEANGLLVHDGKVEGVVARDRLGLETLEFRAPIVINAAGPWCRAVARQCDCTGGDHSPLFQPSLAYNLLLARPALSDCALAVSSGRPNSRVYFLYGACGGVLAGTEHAPALDWDGSSPRSVTPTPEQVQRTLDELNAAVPALDLKQRDVLRVYSGLLPARQAGTDALARRPMFCDHGRRGGVRGLYSVSGVKFTTARLVAERVVRRLPVAPRRGPGIEIHGLREVGAVDLLSPSGILDADDDALREAIARLITEESVINTDDLLMRRTNWLDDPQQERAVRDRVAKVLTPRHEATAQRGERAQRRTVSASRLIDGKREDAILPVRLPH